MTQRPISVALFDPSVDGHHIEYAAYIAQHLIENGDRAVLLSGLGAARRKDLHRLQPALEVIEAFSDAPRDRVMRLIAKRRQLNRSLQWAATRRVDVFHHLFLDGSELAWASANASLTRQFRTYATLFGLRYTALGDARISLAGTTAPLKAAALRHAFASGRLGGVFVHSSRAAGELSNLVKLAGQGSVTVVPDPVPPLIHLDKREARVRLGLPDNKIILLFFGGLRWDKGPDLLLEALRDVKSDYLAVFAGEPSLFPIREIRRLANDLPDPSRVILRLRAVEDAEVDLYFAAADAVILPYRVTFAGTSGVLSRAVAARRPLIATRVGDVGVTVSENGLGLVVAPEPRAIAQAIEQFLRDPHGTTQSVAERASSYAIDHSAGRLARTVRKTYGADSALDDNPVATAT